jgi:hypothetical protein
VGPGGSLLVEPAHGQRQKSPAEVVPVRAVQRGREVGEERPEAAGLERSSRVEESETGPRQVGPADALTHRGREEGQVFWRTEVLRGA